MRLSFLGDAPLAKRAICDLFGFYQSSSLSLSLVPTQGLWERCNKMIIRRDLGVLTQQTSEACWNSVRGLKRVTGMAES